jgi:hypothetical protein
MVIFDTALPPSSDVQLLCNNRHRQRRQPLLFFLDGIVQHCLCHPTLGNIFQKPVTNSLSNNNLSIYNNGNG